MTTVHRKMPIYEFEIRWQHLAGEDPDARLHKVIHARSVPNALTRFYRAMTEEGYGKSRKGFHIIEVSNKDIT